MAGGSSTCQRITSSPATPTVPTRPGRNRQPRARPTAARPRWRAGRAGPARRRRFRGAHGVGVGSGRHELRQDDGAAGTRTRHGERRTGPGRLAHLVQRSCRCRDSAGSLRCPGGHLSRYERWFDELVRLRSRRSSASSEPIQGELQPTTSAEFVRPAPRPAYSVLADTSWRAAGFGPLPQWQDALHQGLAEILNAAV